MRLIKSSQVEVRGRLGQQPVRAWGTDDESEGDYVTTYVEWTMIQAIEELLEALMKLRARLLAGESTDRLSDPT